MHNFIEERRLLIGKNESLRGEMRTFSLIATLACNEKIRFFRGEMAIFIGEIGVEMTLAPIFRGEIHFSEEKRDRSMALDQVT